MAGNPVRIVLAPRHVLQKGRAVTMVGWHLFTLTVGP